MTGGRRCVCIVNFDRPSFDCVVGQRTPNLCIPPIKIYANRKESASFTNCRCLVGLGRWAVGWGRWRHPRRRRAAVDISRLQLRGIKIKGEKGNCCQLVNDYSFHYVDLLTWFIPPSVLHINCRLFVSRQRYFSKWGRFWLICCPIKHS